VDKTLQFLVVGPDPALHQEFGSALRRLNDLQAVTHVASDGRQGVEAARSRQPDVVFVEMTRDPRALKTFAEEVAVGSPDSIVVGVYRREVLGGDASEGGVIIDALRSRVRDFMRRPLSSTELQDVLDRHLLRTAPRLATSGKVVAFVSNKGGVGKSTLSLNVACALAERHPDRVLLVDASLQLGVCASMLDLEPETSIVDAVREVDRLDETLLRQLTVAHPCGLRLLAAPADAIEAAPITDAAIARILTLARRTFDYVVVDTFPMLDSVALTVLDLSDLVHVVVSPSVPHVIGATRFLAVLDRLAIPRARQSVVLNHHFPGVAGALERSDIEARLDREIAHVFPYRRRLLVAMNVGRPYVLGTSHWMGFGKSMSRLVGQVESLRGSVDRVAPADEVNAARVALATGGAGA
jgi:pilus assembly protein CpaE